MSLPQDCPVSPPFWEHLLCRVYPELEIPSFKWKRGLKWTRNLAKPVYVIHNSQISFNSYLHNILELVCVQKAQRTGHTPRQRGCWGTLWGTLSLSLARGCSVG